MRIDTLLTTQSLLPDLERFWTVSGQKINDLNQNYNPAKGSPVFTVEGEYTTRGWTEWTQGFQYGGEILQFDATDDASFLEMGKKTPSKRWLRTLVTSGCTTMDLTMSAPTGIYCA